MQVVLKKTAWYLFAILAIGVSFYPLMYWLADGPFGLLFSKTEELLANNLWNIGFYSHITFGGIALGVGWIQFNQKLRKTRAKLHRNIGKVYVLAVLLSGICSLYIAAHATGGLVCVAGFTSLGIVWLSTTTLGFLAARKGDFDGHQKWMIYSYAACFGAVMLRLWLPILTPLMGGFIPAYRIIAWLSWVPNLIVAYFIINRKKLT